MSDPFKILGVQSGATDDEVKKAYKNLARKYHPDKGGTAEKFKEINEAYTKIIKGADPMSEFPELSELFKMFGSMGGLNMGLNMGNIMGGMGQFMRGPTVSTSVDLTLEQLELGGLFKLKYHRKIPTGNYTNTVSHTPFGIINVMTPEEIDKEYEVELYIPSCCDQRKPLIFHGLAKAENLPVGDIEVTLNIQKHDVFTRVNGTQDLETSLDISLMEALTGFQREINLLNSGLVKIECSSVVNPYDSKTIPNYGMQYYNESGVPEKRGNLVLRFKIRFPLLVSEEIKTKLKDIDFELF